MSRITPGNFSTKLKIDPQSWSICDFACFMQEIDGGMEN